MALLGWRMAEPATCRCVAFVLCGLCVLCVVYVHNTCQPAKCRCVFACLCGAFDRCMLHRITKNQCLLSTTFFSFTDTWSTFSCSSCPTPTVMPYAFILSIHSLTQLLPHRYLVHILLQLLPHPSLQRAVLKLLHTLLDYLLVLALPDGHGLSARESVHGQSVREDMSATATPCWPALTWQVSSVLQFSCL